MGTVVKHSYTRGSRTASRSAAHAQYAANRPGEDRPPIGGRPFFDEHRADYPLSNTLNWLADLNQSNFDVMHRMMFSPGLDGVDIADYTREVMNDLGRAKGLDLNWRGVVHENTAHPHSHVMIYGVDKNGRQVSFNKDDYKNARESGDDYLNREHGLDRYLDRESHYLLNRHDYHRSGDDLFMSMFRDKKEHESDPARVAREFREFEDNLHKPEERSQDLYYVYGKQRVIEDSGRLSDFHGTYTAAMERQRLNQFSQEHPDRAEETNRSLNYLNESKIDFRIEDLFKNSENNSRDMEQKQRDMESNLRDQNKDPKDFENAHHGAGSGENHAPKRDPHEVDEQHDDDRDKEPEELKEPNAPTYMEPPPRERAESPPSESESKPTAKEEGLKRDEEEDANRGGIWR
ncbi:unnamed protein product [Sphagnum balticum]